MAPKHVFKRGFSATLPDVEIYQEIRYRIDTKARQKYTERRHVPCNSTIGIKIVIIIMMLMIMILIYINLYILLFVIIKINNGTV